MVSLFDTTHIQTRAANSPTLRTDRSNKSLFYSIFCQPRYARNFVFIWRDWCSGIDHRLRTVSSSVRFPLAACSFCSECSAAHFGLQESSSPCTIPCQKTLVAPPHPSAAEGACLFVVVSGHLLAGRRWDFRCHLARLTNRCVLCRIVQCTPRQTRRREPTVLASLG